LGWFGWVQWGRPGKPLREVAAVGSEAEAFVGRLKAAEAESARERIRTLREGLRQMESARDSKYAGYAREFRDRFKKGPDRLDSLDIVHPRPREARAMVSDLGKQDIMQLYGIARQLDRRFHDLYRAFRACELARIQHMPLPKALALTRVTAPDHPDVDPVIFRTRVMTTSGDDFARLKEQLSVIRIEIKRMAGNARRMLDMAALVEPGLLGVGSDWDVGAGDDWAMFEKTASVFDRRPSLYRGQSGAEPNAFQHEWGGGDGPVTKKNLNLPTELGVDLSHSVPVPGRKLLKEGRKRDWMFVNAWYVIGPFPNPNRVNLNKKFPPEMSIDPRLGFVGIDLDASYMGAEQKRVRWEYLATDRRVCFVPHRVIDWAIWYAYTEIWSEIEQDRWCIFGADDYNRCWINGEPVYQGHLTPHVWLPDREYKRIRFKKGFNTVLYKLENTWGRIGFSLCVYTGEAADES